MSISRARHNFRIFLGILLLFSIGFFSVSAYYYTSVRQHKIKISSIAPILFQIDIYTYYAKTYFQDKENQFKTAKTLYAKGIFDPLYSQAGNNMMTKLADSGYAPSQVFQADLLMVHGNTQEHKAAARQYYENAANQKYSTAIERLSVLRN